MEAPDEDAARVAAAIVASLGLDEPTLTPVHGQGCVNHVFLGRGVVVRFACDRLRDGETAEGEFVKEAWCMDAAGAVGVPVPAVVATGVLDGRAYGVHERIMGVPATQRRPAGLFTTLARWACQIAQIRLTPDAPSALFSRFGRDLPAAWDAHLRYNIEALTADDPLVRLGVYAVADQPRLRDELIALASQPLAFGLYHGDLSAKNTMVRDDGSLILIDWGAAGTGPVPWGDLVHLDLCRREQADPSDDELGQFTAAWGDLPVEPTLRRLHLLRGLDLVRWSLDQRPDLLDHYIDHGRMIISAAAA